MIFDLATDTQMQAARIFGGATMVAFLAVPIFRRQAHRARMTIAVIYFAGVTGFVIYVLM